MSKNNTGENNGNWRGGGYVKCPVCEKDFWKIPAVTQIFCSNRCFHKVRFGNDRPKSGVTNRFGMSGTKSGKRADLGIFVRSSWEANYARYLNWLQSSGLILSWEYEAETFEFDKIKKGTKFYTPDFKVEMPDHTIEYHEVKGYMHPKGKTALARMKKYHPHIKIILIQKEEYYALKSKMSKIIPLWE